MMTQAKQTTSRQLPPKYPSFREALGFWFKLGCISFGGPAGQIAIMHQELVEKRRWISEQRFLHALNYCMLLPGPEAQQLATYLGWLMHRTWGGVVAGLLFVLPSLVLLIGLSWLYMLFGQTSVVQGLFYGIKPAVTAIVVLAAWRLGSRVLKNAWLCVIALLAFLALAIFALPFPAVVIAAGLFGLIGGRVMPQIFSVVSGHADSEIAQTSYAIDDASPTPQHALFKWPSLIKVLAVGGVLWLMPILALLFFVGEAHPFTQMAWFFTKAALLTFGGAYAVLPYVYQGAVERFSWLSPQQMIDGLALGETTPGPLIMVVAFVAFVGGFTKAPIGLESSYGVTAALIVTWFTFLPSFIFILAGGPWVESSRGNIKFTAPLTAISAAVVGVIASLALFFARHVFWPKGLHLGNGISIFNGMDWVAVFIAIAAFIALLRFKRSVIQVIIASAIFGLFLSLGVGKYGH